MAEKNDNTWRNSFGTTSLICGLAPNETVLILSRLVQGIGAAIMWPNAVGLVANSFPKKDKQMALGALTSVAVLGTAFGPLVGGMITEFVSWRLVFFVNVPIAIAVVTIITLVAKESKSSKKPEKIDYLGVLLISSGLIIATFAIDQTSEWGWLSVETIGTLLVGVLLLIAFVANEKIVKWPLVDLSLFKNKAFMIQTGAGTIGNAGLVAVMFFSTILLQQVRDLSAAQASLVFLALSIGVASASKISEGLNKVPAHKISSFALVLGGIGLFLMTLSDNIAFFMIAMAVTGFGLGMAFSYTLAKTQSFVSRERAGEASGVTMTFLVSIGGVLLAVAASLLTLATDNNNSPLTDAIYELMRGFAILNILGGITIYLSKNVFETVKSK